VVQSNDEVRPRLPGGAVSGNGLLGEGLAQLRLDPELNPPAGAVTDRRGDFSGAVGGEYVQLAHAALLEVFDPIF
jgi:hypothetical protein